jgi:hypothetical protein
MLMSTKMYSAIAAMMFMAMASMQVQGFVSPAIAASCRATRLSVSSSVDESSSSSIPAPVPVSSDEKASPAPAAAAPVAVAPAAAASAAAAPAAAAPAAAAPAAAASSSQSDYGGSLPLPNTYVRCSKCQAHFALQPDDLGERGKGRYVPFVTEMSKMP